MGILNNIPERIAGFAEQDAAANLREFFSSRQPLIWLLAAVTGAVVAYAAIGFRLAIGYIQWPWLGTTSERVGTAAAHLPFWVILMVPVTGGVLTGLLLRFIMPGRRPQGVADVIESRALDEGRMDLKAGLTSAVITIVSLGFGASAGREGPVVHLGATLSSTLACLFKLPAAAVRALLGCGVAAAIAASFNAPIAGTLFALEVVLGHYALNAFVPIVLSSAIATVITRVHLGNFPAFVLPHYNIMSYWEFAAFALLGMVCALVAVAFQLSVHLAEKMADRLDPPIWLRPVGAGVLVGLIAMFFPHVLGVGYEATDLTLKEYFGIGVLFSLLFAKMTATAITLAGRFGGGVFSPSLYLGAVTGGIFGQLAAMAAPGINTSYGLYAILGMGGVAAAVLGAPISTTLIIFELTGGFDISIALLLTISIAAGLTQALHGRGFFHWQLAGRGLFLTDGPHQYIGHTIRVLDFMELVTEDHDLEAEEDDISPLSPQDTLEVALRRFDSSGKVHLMVADPESPGRIIGRASRLDALEAYNNALIRANVEEHR